MSLAVIIGLIGLLLYLFADGKVSEIGRIAFFAGLWSWLRGRH